MQNVPNIISTKDLSYICDMFNWNFTTAKKALHYSNNVTDNEIKEELLNIFDMHKQICNGLLNILNGGENE
jgi:hypothetical protein